MGKAADNKLFKRSKLLDTAFALFTKKGISDTSISEITTRAKIGKGTFYLYFKDKQDLRLRLIAHRASILFDHAIDVLAQHEEELTLPDKVVILINDLIDQLSDDKALLNFIQKNLSWSLFRGSLEQYAKSGPASALEAVFGDRWSEFDEPELMIYTILELASSTCGNIILNDEPVTLSTYRSYLEKNIRSIIENHRRI